MINELLNELDKQNILLTAGNIGHFNSMTIGWINIGRLWHRHTLLVYVRPTRYTYEFIEKYEYFSVNFFEEKYSDIIDFFGTYSGRSVDKMNYNKLTPIDYNNKAVYYKESFLKIICKKIYSFDIKKENFLNKSIITHYYSDNNFHRAYIGEIIEIFS
ncbi:MAG: flavin reductase [Bacteroidales bacterium]|nr:flavin reductase [Bacteroidales bacterium]